MQIMYRHRTVINSFGIVFFLRDYALPVTLTFDVRMNNALRAASGAFQSAGEHRDYDFTSGEFRSSGVKQ